MFNNILRLLVPIFYVIVTVDVLGTKLDKDIFKSIFSVSYILGNHNFEEKK
jgi:hypothetical protein